ncbi:MAG: phospholipase, partial [Bacteroidetes bacterium]|nr:phospholipase [Bacteroidota bacterium]
MVKKYISVQRTARYFISKEMDEKVKQVIFVLHGYAQNADDFLASCSELASEEILLLAPEGLSKFYW